MLGEDSASKSPNAQRIPNSVSYFIEGRMRILHFGSTYRWTVFTHLSLLSLMRCIDLSKSGSRFNRNRLQPETWSMLSETYGKRRPEVLARQKWPHWFQMASSRLVEKKVTGESTQQSSRLARLGFVVRLREENVEASVRTRENPTPTSTYRSRSLSLAILIASEL